MNDTLNLFVAQQKLKRQVFEIWDDAVVEVLPNKDSSCRRSFMLRMTRYRSLRVEIELTEQELLNEHNLILTSVIPRLHSAWEHKIWKSKC